ncbi:TetR/AcrR family transcriptional regulator [Parvibaculaceae bacterium PLY_AMNH_Bact1]|nr:TetR/AcrR family transcriptional regulator [Parvibaculaceae bacterium PLY_AMNH_Bact1]
MVRASPNRSEATKRGILDVACQHFSSVGFEGTSTRRIATEAGINHSLIVYHFKNKDGLWKAVMEDLFAIAAAHAAEHCASSDDPVETLRADLHAFVTFCAEHPELHRIMTIEGRMSSDRLSWLLDTYLKGNFASVSSRIRTGQADGRIRQGSPAQLYYGAIGIAGTLATLAREYEALSGESATSEASITSAKALIDALLFSD